MDKGDALTKLDKDIRELSLTFIQSIYFPTLCSIARLIDVEEGKEKEREDEKELLLNDISQIRQENEELVKRIKSLR